MDTYHRTISLMSAVALLLWGVGGALIAVSAMTVRWEYAVAGLYVTGVAMVLSVRSFFIRFEAHLVARERNAFHLGGEVRRLRP